MLSAAEPDRALPPFARWLDSGIGWWVLGSALLGVALAYGFLWMFGLSCASDHPDGWWSAQVCANSSHSLWTAVSGLAATPALLLTWYWRTTHRKRDLAVAEANLDLAKQAQFNDRFSRAAELLGSDRIATRLGAIYALDQLSRDAPETYARPVVNSLSALVRERSHVKDEARIPAAGGRWLLATDVEAAFRILCSRNTREIALYGAADLRGAELLNADAAHAVLVLGRFGGADLRNASMYHAGLDKADLSKAKLDRANLEGAWLRHGDLSEASLEHANLRHAGLQGVDLRRSNLENADLRGADACDADFREANLNCVKMQGARYSSGTRFSDDFDPRGAGMVLVTVDDDKAPGLGESG